MKDFLLFIDTEASGLPKKWDLPYQTPGNWPYAVQVSWLIFSKAGEIIKEQNFYISNNDFEISPSAEKIHGITKDFLAQNGIPRQQVLAILAKDLEAYQPMIVGHFIELDYHIIGADCYREGIPHPMEKLPTFCIMTASKHLQKNPRCKYLRLGELYEFLFRIPLTGQHNALRDAAATADCFFELVKRNELTSFDQPPIVFQQKEKINYPVVWIMALVLILFSVLLIVWYYG